MARLAALLALALAAGCADQPAPGRLGATPSSPAGSVAKGPILVDGIEVFPPPWLPAADRGPLAVAIDDYLRYAQVWVRTSWTPEVGSATLPPLRVIFHDVAGYNDWDVQRRTARLEWPRGRSGKPLSTSFAPLLNTVFVLDRRRERGEAQAGPYTQDEIQAMDGGHTLLIYLASTVPSLYE